MSGEGFCSIGKRPKQEWTNDRNAGRNKSQCKQSGQTVPRMSQPESEDRKEIQKDSRMVRCTLLSGSRWNTEEKCMRTYKGTFDIFIGVEHRTRQEEMGWTCKQ